MAKLINRMKLTWLKGMEAIGVSASNMADSAKTKVQEINLETRRREILTSFTMTAFELWQNGETLPASLESILQELKDVDEKLSVLRAQKYARVKGNDEDAEPAVEESPAGEESADDGAEEAAVSAPEEAAATVPEAAAEVKTAPETDVPTENSEMSE